MYVWGPFLDPQLTIHPSKYRCSIKKSNWIGHIFLSVGQTQIDSYLPKSVTCCLGPNWLESLRFEPPNPKFPRSQKWLQVSFKDLFSRQYIVIFFKFSNAIGHSKVYIVLRKLIAIMNEPLFIKDFSMDGWNPSMFSLLQNLTFGERNKVCGMNIFGFFHQGNLRTLIISQSNQSIKWVWCI